ncbi:hypothetical protein GCM10020331_073350 [Ectobacillus funiculus]
MKIAVGNGKAQKTVMATEGFYLNGKKRKKAHRVAYQLHKEDIPVGQMVRHTCDNRACVNPEHLELGTAEQNTQDKVERYRQPWPFPAVCYLEMKFFSMKSVFRWIRLHNISRLERKHWRIDLMI